MKIYVTSKKLEYFPLVMFLYSLSQVRPLCIVMRSHACSFRALPMRKVLTASCRAVRFGLVC